MRGQRRLISYWVIHPHFIASRFHRNDIALLRIDKPFKLNSFVNLIRLLPFSENSFCDISPLYSACRTPMYKNKTLTEDGNFLLLSVFLTNVRNCKKYINESEITGGYSHICSINDLDSKNCVGNLGSPLICKHKQVGILLDVFSCNDTNWSLYTRVDLYQHWIENYVQNGLWYETNFINFTNELEFVSPHLCETEEYKTRVPAVDRSYSGLSYNRIVLVIVILVGNILL